MRDLFGYKEPEKTWEEEYNEYIRSSEWKKKCREAIKRAGEKCEVCGAPKWSKLSVHHITYERFKHELPKDLKVVCARCHIKEDVKREEETKRKNFQKLQDARFYGWAETVYGKNWMIYYKEDEMYELYENWLDEKDEW